MYKVDIEKLPDAVRAKSREYADEHYADKDEDGNWLSDEAMLSKAWLHGFAFCLEGKVNVTTISDCPAEVKVGILEELVKKCYSEARSELAEDTVEQIENMFGKEELPRLV
jgi:hypothetical protein